MVKILSTLVLFTAALSPLHASLVDTADVPYIKGESKTIIEAKPHFVAANEKWFTNDHCFVLDKSGKIHWFGINNPYPPAGKELYRYHPYLGHATSQEMTKGWQHQKFAIDESKGTEYVGAPYVIWHDESQRWAMVVETNRGTRRLEVYWSKNLTDWHSDKKAILPDKLWISARDPHIMKGDDGKYWIHIVAGTNGAEKGSLILRIKTKDFQHFEDPQTILNADETAWATFIESPFLYKHNGLWYLFFTYAHRRYAETIVVVSDNSDFFDYKKNTIATLFGHAAEIFDYKGKTYITSCGPEDTSVANTHGITLAELKWAKQSPPKETEKEKAE